jgi:dTDP-4-amino-4,6-dideoxygalactose transaminase
MIPISRPLIEDAERSAVLAVLMSGQLAHGPRVQEFEERFAAFAGAANAVAVTSGTSSLQLALLRGISPATR